MSKHNYKLLPSLLGAILAWLCSGAVSSAQSYPPPAGAGLGAALQADQDVYTNQPGTVSCPPCTTNTPPCELPCYLTGEQTAVAHFTFAVTNDYNYPRTFEFSSGQQFDIELSDESGQVVAAWSDGMFFTQQMNSFTLNPGETKTFTADMPLKDRNGKQLNGTYQAQAYL